MLVEKFGRNIMDLNNITHDKEFHDIVNNKDSLKRNAESVLNNIIDELTLGIIFDTHREAKMKKIYPDETVTMSIEEETAPNANIFGYNNAEMVLKCDCPICERSISATRFAPHLQKCMGLRTSRVRPTRRRIVMTNETNNNRDRGSYESGTDKEDDDDWIMGERRRKKKQRNGKKKGKGTGL